MFWCNMFFDDEVLHLLIKQSWKEVLEADSRRAKYSAVTLYSRATCKNKALW